MSLPARRDEDEQPAVPGDDLGRDMYDLALEETGLGELEAGQETEARPRIVPYHRDRRPSVGRVDHEGVGIERGETCRDLSSDLVRDPWGAEQQELVVSNPAREGASRNEEQVERTGLGRSRDDADQSAGKLTHGAGPPQGRRRVSARRWRMTRRRRARSGRSRPSRGSIRARSSRRRP